MKKNFTNIILPFLLLPLSARAMDQGVMSQINGNKGRDLNIFASSPTEQEIEDLAREYNHFSVDKSQDKFADTIKKVYDLMQSLRILIPAEDFKHSMIFVKTFIKYAPGFFDDISNIVKENHKYDYSLFESVADLYIGFIAIHKNDIQKIEYAFEGSKKIFLSAAVVFDKSEDERILHKTMHCMIWFLDNIQRNLLIKDQKIEIKIGEEDVREFIIRILGKRKPDGGYLYTRAVYERAIMIILGVWVEDNTIDILGLNVFDTLLSLLNYIDHPLNWAFSICEILIKGEGYTDAVALNSKNLHLFNTFLVVENSDWNVEKTLKCIKNLYKRSSDEVKPMIRAKFVKELQNLKQSVQNLEIIPVYNGALTELLALIEA